MYYNIFLIIVIIQGKAMLIEFRVKNFYSIQDEQVFSLVANSQKEHKNNTFTLEKDLSLLKSVAIYGANAAGKTNLIKAFSAMEEIILKSAMVQRGAKSIRPCRKP